MPLARRRGARRRVPHRARRARPRVACAWSSCCASATGSRPLGAAAGFRAARGRRAGCGASCTRRRRAEERRLPHRRGIHASAPARRCRSRSAGIPRIDAASATSIRRSAADARRRAGGANGRSATATASTATIPGASAVSRSLITLKALTYEPTGGIVAAATTSLPEEHRRRAQLGLPLLLDPRRDADALRAAHLRLPGGGARLARMDAARRRRASLAAADHVRPRRRAAAERDRAALAAGYEKSKPVRIGNAAYDQLQLDVYGELMDALHVGRKFELDDRRRTPGTSRRCCSTISRRNGDGPTRASGRSAAAPRHFTHSKLMAWVAYDRAVRAWRTSACPARSRNGGRLRETIRADILRARLERQAEELRADLWRRRARRLAAADPAGRLPAAGGSARRLHRRSDPARADRGRPAAALPARSRRTTGSPGARARSSSAASGLPTRSA